MNILVCFQDQEKCDFVLTDVLFAFNEIYWIDKEVNTLLDFGFSTFFIK